jgi:hypothetical protein
MADHQKFPSTAHYENERYVHDPLNQPLAEAEKQGKLGAQNVGQYEHPFPAPIGPEKQ